MKIGLLSDVQHGTVTVGYFNWKDLQLKRLLSWSTKFVVGYHSAEGSEVVPNTMKSYLFGLQLYFKEEWEYYIKITKRHIYASQKERLMSVAYKRFSKQQEKGITICSHSVLNNDDVYKLYLSSDHFKNTPSSYQCRMIFNFSLLTAMRPTELHQLLFSQLLKVHYESHLV